MEFTERYVSVTGGGAHNGTSPANAWTFDEAVAGYSAGHRLNVKTGNYTCSVANPICRVFSSGAAGTRANPVAWRGYSTTIGDGGVPVFTITDGSFVMSAGYVGVWSAESIKFSSAREQTIWVGADETPLFRNCVIENTYNGNTYVGHALSGADAGDPTVGAGGMRAENCVFTTANATNTTFPSCVHNIKWVSATGCLFQSAGNGIRIIAPVGGLIQNCEFSRVGARAKGTETAIYIYSATSAQKVIANCDFLDYSIAIDYWCDIEMPVITNSMFVKSLYSFKFQKIGGGDVVNHPIFSGNAKLNGNIFERNSLAGLSYNELEMQGGWVTLVEEPTSSTGVLLTNASARSCITGGILSSRNIPIGSNGASDWPTAANVRLSTSYKHGALTGTCAVPTAANVRLGTATDNTTGTCAVPTAANTKLGIAVDNTTGICAVPSAANTRLGVATGTTTGTCAVPAAADVRLSTAVDATVGTCAVPTAANVRHGTAVDATTGTCRVPTAANVRYGTAVDATTGTCRVPTAADVRLSTLVDATTGTCAVPAATDTRSGVAVDATTGTCVVPDADDVRLGVAVDVPPGEGTLVVGSYPVTLPEEASVLSGVEYGNDETPLEGKYVEPDPDHYLTTGAGYGPDGGTDGTATVPEENTVLATAPAYGPGGDTMLGTYIPTAAGRDLTFKNEYGEQRS